MLIVDRLKKSYILPGNQEITVLNINHFQMNNHEKVGLVGPSGSGKSTFLNIIAGIVRPTTGIIFMMNTQIDQLPEAKLDHYRARQVGYVFQNFNLLSGYTALENVLIAMQFGNVISRNERRKKAIELLSQVGLDQRLHHKSGQLSNGEQQRVAIARALANRPSLVLADEPTASLDYHNAQQVSALLADACRVNGAALLLCTHDLELANKMDRIVNIRDLSDEYISEVG
jgi:ABC-type lipoprotein export system ATPase subunit